MTKFYKYITTFVIVLGISVMGYAQKDTTGQKVKKFDADSKVLKSNEALKSKGATKKVKNTSNFKLKSKAALNTDAVKKQLSGHRPKPNNFLMETLPEDQDIMGKKYWKGKDVTHKRLSSDLSLGSVNTNSNTVRIECRDYSLVDGDRIRVYHNETAISDNIGLKGNYYVVYLTLKKGYNRIDFQALNQGYSGPNTAELLVYDQKGNLISSKEWSLATNQIATLGVIKF